MGYMSRRELELRIEELERVIMRMNGRIRQLEDAQDPDDYDVLSDEELACIESVFGGTD